MSVAKAERALSRRRMCQPDADQARGRYAAFATPPCVVGHPQAACIRDRGVALAGVAHPHPQQQPPLHPRYKGPWCRLRSARHALQTSPDWSEPERGSEMPISGCASASLHGYPKVGREARRKMTQPRRRAPGLANFRNCLAYESASASMPDLAIAFLIFSALADRSLSLALARNLSSPPR